MHQLVIHFGTVLTKGMLQKHILNSIFLQKLLVI